MQSNQENVIADGGFRIEIRPDSFDVVPDSHARIPRKQKTSGQIFGVILVIAVVLYFLFDVLPKIIENTNLSWVLVALFGVPLLWSYWKGENSLQCTRESLTVVRTARGRVRGTRSFSRNSVKRIRFGAVGVSRYGSINGIVFESAGKKIKTLPNMESPEAQTILREFDRLGYDVVHDVGMPMMVEMALERRKGSIL